MFHESRGLLASLKAERSVRVYFPLVAESGESIYTHHVAAVPRLRLIPCMPCRVPAATYSTPQSRVSGHVGQLPCQFGVPVGRSVLVDQRGLDI